MQTIKLPQQVNYPSLPTLIRFNGLNNMRPFAPDSFQILPGPGKEQPFDGSTPWNTETLKFDTALKRLAMEGQIHDSLYCSLREVKTEAVANELPNAQEHTKKKMEAFQISVV